MEYLLIAAAIVVLVLAGAALLVLPRSRKDTDGETTPGGTTTLERPEGPERSTTETAEAARTEAAEAEEHATGTDTSGTDTTTDATGTDTSGTAPAPPTPPAEPAPQLEQPEPTAGRLTRLRSRLAGSQTSLGRGLLTLLSRDRLDDEAWEEIEDTLLTADVGITATTEIVERLRERTRVLGTRSPAELRALLTEELVGAIGAETDRELKTFPHADAPAVVLVVGVNGTGKTTTCGKMARVLVADGRSVLLGAADTFRAAAADQLETWGSRVGARTVRGAEGADPASVAFEAVKQGIEDHVDTVLIDTAGRLHTKAGLMDELGKVRRVVEKQAPVDEVLLVLDATTGQNGLVQARAFLEAVECTGIVLTKLDSTAKGGIVISVQRELGVPVKLIGLGEGKDDMAPFEPKAFVDALLGEVA